MAIKTDIRGMIWRYPEPFVVGREKIREFATSVKAEDRAHYDEAAAAELGYDALLAPLTFVAILAKLVQADFFRNVDTGYTTMQMVQVGEEAGQLDTLLLKVADTFELESKRAIDRLLAALVPALTIVMTVLVAVIMAAILLPLLSLTSNIQ